MQHSTQAKANRRNSNATKRNQKQAERNPLFAQAGILDQVVKLSKCDWTALEVTYHDLARDIEAYERRLAQEKRNKARYEAYKQILSDAIGPDNFDEVEADYNQRWHTGHPMQQWEYRLNYLNNYIATFTKRAPLDIWEQAKAIAGV